MPSLSSLVPSFIRRRYLVKFVVSILAVVLVIGAVGAVSYADIDNTVRADSNEQLESTAEMQADAISNWVETMRVQTRTASDSQILQEGDPQEVQGQLVEEQARMDVDVRAIHYVDTENGEIVTSTNADYRGESFADLEEPWATDDFGNNLGLEESVWHSQEAYQSPTLDDQVMAFASPVTEREDRAVVIIGTLEYQVEQLHQENTSASTAIIDSDGSAVFQAESASIDEAAIDDEAMAAALGGRLTRMQDGDVVRAYVPVGNTQWVAVTSVPTDQAYGVASDVGTNVVAMVLTSLLALGVVGVVLGRQTVGPLARLRDRTTEMEQGNLNVDLETNRVDEIGRLYDGFDSMRNSLRDQIEAAETAREEAEAARAETESINRHLEAKAEEFSAVMDDCADGDLTRRLDPESESQAMTDIADAFNEMIADLEETTADVKAFANEVAAASEQVTASSEEVRSASQQVSESVQEISDGADRQNENLHSVNQEMSGLSTTTEEIAASSNNVADLAEQTAETGRLGREAAQEAIDGMHEIEAESTEAVEAIRELEAEMTQIDELVEFISDVARETNMLALNANIEASRGGDGEGSGFGAVATQVKELAADTKSTAEDIEQRLEQIDEQTAETATEVQQTADRIAEHVDSVENAAEALDEIADYADRTNEGVQEISAATEEQAASTQEVVAMVSSATDISESTAAEAQRVAAAAEEQTSALSEVTESASSLTDQATYLSETLDHFETDETADVSVDDSGTDETVAFDELDIDDADSAVDTDSSEDTDGDTGEFTPETNGGITDASGIDRDAEPTPVTDDGNDLVHDGLRETIDGADVVELEEGEAAESGEDDAAADSESTHGDTGDADAADDGDDDGTVSSDGEDGFTFSQFDDE
ncbi:methyl-accepting chemotaxis sensory transducer [Haloterrigena turkmenica DSM 5511]|uniref:Methyl-accepting chemotaxis sensory transducer n=1 Tax=Haloterrigena turkmenica (strain ATCC 51198 / DSM 5511 / JCM 9101 / NCIMB 13204 / VKM B-1734 / 4k) TaxID=543526 RepID=D2RPP6_HALTV|nr:methyl-accepting chemotaxis protein [Haloterrigena turkmenica]ADB62198.1 methyl-accepting chemotaxis sensory transducer [Haloterrigena turkmenica DSM 5511]